MSLTLNIVEHELKKEWPVARSFEGNPAFSDVRLHLPGKPIDPETLYVCSAGEDAAAISEAGAFAVYVGPALRDPGSQHGAPALAIAGEVAPLAVFDALLDVFGAYDRWRQDRERIQQTGGSLQELLDASEPFLQNNVVVLDPALKLIAYTKNVPCDDPITMELIEHGYHTEENIRKFKLHKRFKPWAEDEGFVVNDSHEICKYVTVVKSFKAHSSFTLISVMMCNIADLEPYLLDIYGLFCDSVCFFALRDYPDGKPSGHAIDSFLNDLIANAAGDDAAIVERCRYVGLPYQATFCVFYLKAPVDSVPVTRLVADVSLIVAPAKTALVGDAVAVLCFNCSNRPCASCCDISCCTHTGLTITERLEDMLARYELTCGRSSKFSKLSGMSTAFAQAREAYILGGRIGRRLRNGCAHVAPTRIFSFDQYCMDYLVGRLSESELSLVTSTYAGSVISAIAEHDAQANTDNYEFLYGYLLHERRTSAAAEALHMHRNNANYRIGRIEELYGIDVSDPAFRVDLLVAYQLRSAAIVQSAQSISSN